MASRKGNGEGSVYRDGARWRGAVTLANGQRKKVSGKDAGGSGP